MVLEQGELLLVGTTRQALAKITDAASLIPSDGDLANMPESSARWLAHWLLALPLDEATRITQLARLAGLSHACARSAALRALMQMAVIEKSDLEELCSSIAIFCHDQEEAIALAAVHHLMTVEWAGLNRLLFKLNQESPHESLRTVAADRLAPVGFSGLWRSWAKLGQPQRLAAAKALLKLDDRFYHQLDQRIVSDDPRIRMKAIEIIASLNQGALFEKPLLLLARDEDEKLAASAVRALASAQSQEATDVLEASLAHGCARVRANAVEALSQQRISRSMAMLREMAGREENRPRANAIAQLLRIGDGQAVAQLRTMLADLKPQHRISALWAAEHEGRIDVVSEVAEMVITDADVNVRERAVRTLKQLIGRMRLVEFESGVLKSVG